MEEDIIRKILAKRGVTSDEGIEEFLSAKPRLVHDPFLMPGMGEAVTFVAKALYRGDMVCVYGDYDADGVCATALLTLFLKETALLYGSKSVVGHYIPSRKEEGYGLNKEALLGLKGAGVGSVITVDCGCVNAEEAAYAEQIGMGLLITDHHDMDEANLPGCIVLNPKRAGEGGDSYPFPLLSGAGVAFKLCCAVAERLSTGPSDTPLKKSLHRLIDLVAVATVADVVPLVDENRTFVKYGLSMLRNNPRPAFKELIRLSGVEQRSLSARDIAFGLAPRINSLGRMGDASPAADLFLAEAEEEILKTARKMDRCNKERQAVQEKCFQACMDLCEADGGTGHGFLLLAPEKAHEGVSGIVAGKVREQTGLPCAVLAETADGLHLKSSARSCGRLDLTALLRRHAGLFERLGGHSAAAGFLVKKENLEALRKALDGDLAALLSEDPSLLDETYEADAEISASDVTLGLAEAIEALAPFGAGNPEPMLTMNVQEGGISAMSVMGKDRSHVRFRAGGVPCVFFGGAGMPLPKGPASIDGCPSVNEWNGSRSVQFMVTGVHEAEGALRQKQENPAEAGSFGLTAYHLYS